MRRRNSRSSSSSSSSYLLHARGTGGRLTLLRHWRRLHHRSEREGVPPLAGRALERQQYLQEEAAMQRAVARADKAVEPVDVDRRGARQPTGSSESFSLNPAAAGEILLMRKRTRRESAGQTGCREPNVEGEGDESHDAQHRFAVEAAEAAVRRVPKSMITTLHVHAFRSRRAEIQVATKDFLIFNYNFSALAPGLNVLLLILRRGFSAPAGPPAYSTRRCRPPSMPATAPAVCSLQRHPSREHDAELRRPFCVVFRHVADLRVLHTRAPSAAPSPSWRLAAFALATSAGRALAASATLFIVPSSCSTIVLYKVSAAYAFSSISHSRAPSCRGPSRSS